AMIRKLQGRADEATALLRQALEKDPALAAAHRELAVLLLAKRDWEQAIVHFKEVTRLQPADIAAWLPLAVALIQGGRTDEARACCTDALRRLDEIGEEAPRLRRDLHNLMSQIPGPAPPPAGSSRTR